MNRYPSSLKEDIRLAENTQVKVVLDPGNFYQVLGHSNLLIGKNGQKGKYSSTLSYSNETLGTTNIRPVSKSIRVTTSIADAKRPESFLTLTVEYRDWSIEPVAEKRFYLSGYGLPEPSLAELNGETGIPLWFWILIGIAGLLLLWLLDRHKEAKQATA